VSLVGVTIYPIDTEFHLKGLIEIPRVRWDGGAWRYKTGFERRFTPSGRNRDDRAQRGTLSSRRSRPI